MLKITAINEEKLKAAGFAETPNGFSKEIPNCFRFCYTLYILPDDIYGTITGKMGSDESLDYEDWLDKLCFRDEEKRQVLTSMLSELEESGAITTAAQLTRLARAYGKTWNISRQAKLPASGYICPHCSSKEKDERLKRFLSYIKWLFITAAGVGLYIWAADYAYMERGYKAYGGECFFLLLPLFWYLIGATVKDGVATVKEILKEDLQQ